MPSTTANSPIKVRAPSARDTKPVADIHADASRAAYEGLVPDTHFDASTLEKRQDFWRDAIEDGEPQMLVATIDDKVVGFVGFDRSRDAGTPPTLGEIWAIYVAPSHFGRGIGQALCEAACVGLQDEGCTHVMLWLAVKNMRAIKFHSAAGFKTDTASIKTVTFGGVQMQEVRLKRTV